MGSGSDVAERPAAEDGAAIQTLGRHVGKTDILRVTYSLADPRERAMPFKWDLLKPGRDITDDQRAIVREIGLRFVKDGAGTPTHQKKVDLGGARGLLSELEQLGLIRNHWDKYYPTFPALYFLPSPVRDAYAAYLDCIFEAIQILFQRDGPHRFQIGELEAETNLVVGKASTEIARSGLQAVHFRTAVFFLRDFRETVQAEDSPTTDVGAIIATDRFYDSVDLQKAWEFETARKRPQYMEPPVAHPTTKEVVAEVSYAQTISGGVRGDWEIIGEPLGSGGQSTVYLVRSPKRTSERQRSIDVILSFNQPAATLDSRAKRTGEFAEAIASYARNELPSDLGAMKVFKLREAGPAGEQQAANRLQKEVEVLKAGRDGLPKLLDHNLAERWMVTEYFPEKSLEYNLARYKGNAALSLKAFFSLAKTVAALHDEGIIHRDIKPGNVFVRDVGQLVLGDFGIVFLADQPNRPTFTGESVGPHDYMPPWAEVEGRLADVRQNFDIYMLGKLLWCMVTGRLRLQREYIGLPANNVTVLFNDDPAMHMVDRILRRCVVEREEDCKTSAAELVQMVSALIQTLDRGGQLLHAGVPRPCRVCGSGHYQSGEFPASIPQMPKEGPVGLQFWIHGSDRTTVSVFPYVCDNCGHVAFFTRGAARPGSRGSPD
jgi:serine/threonine protein kinase